MSEGAWNVKRLLVTTVLIVLTAAAAPAAQAKTAGPSASIAKAGDCSTLVYSWTNFRKAQAATLLLHHNGIYQDEATTQPVGAEGSFAIPTRLVAQIQAGEHYTVLGLLRDSSGRSINPSGAAWWGYC
jgi:hypothetical protein